MTQADDRHLASRVAARTQIRDVRLWKSSVELDSVPVGEDALEYTFKTLDSSVDWEPGDDSFVVRIQYGVDVTQSQPRDGDDVKSVDIARLEFTMASLFTIEMRDGDADATQEEVLAYARTTGAFALYPFVREYVYDVTGRLRLPPLTLGVSIIPVKHEEV